jgi:RNase H-like domain found in reverse transcriptase
MVWTHHIARGYQVQPEKPFRSSRHGASTDSSGFAAIFMWVELAAHFCSELRSTGRPALANVEEVSGCSWKDQNSTALLWSFPNVGVGRGSAIQGFAERNCGASHVITPGSWESTLDAHGCVARILCGCIDANATRRPGKECRRAATRAAGIHFWSIRERHVHWSVPEKEAFAIVAGMTRLRYLTVMRTVNVHKDHRNLTFIYDPESSNPNIASYVASKVQRWGVILSEFDYAVYHIDGELNYFVDLMTRWTVSKLRRLVLAPVSTPDADDNEQHLIDLVKASQADLSEVEKKRLDLKLKQGLLWMGDRVYVPLSAMDIKLRLLIVAHCGRSGQIPYDETRRKLLQGFVWDNEQGHAIVS